MFGERKFSSSIGNSPVPGWTAPAVPSTDKARGQARAAASPKDGLIYIAPPANHGLHLLGRRVADSGPQVIRKRSKGIVPTWLQVGVLVGAVLLATTMLLSGLTADEWSYAQAHPFDVLFAYIVMALLNSLVLAGLIAVVVWVVCAVVHVVVRSLAWIGRGVWRLLHREGW